MNAILRLLRLLVLAAGFGLFVSASAAPEYPKQGPDIYDTQADGSAQIAAAFAQAASQHKRVLLDFGANWCPWCHKLHHTFTTDPAVTAALARDYVLVMIDVNTRRGAPRNAAVDERYGHPIQHGLPVLVVLDADGTQLATQETGALENGRGGHDPAKILRFLAQWSDAK